MTEESQNRLRGIEMKVRIEETKLIKSLNIIDPKRGIDWISDFCQCGISDDFNNYYNVIDDNYDGEDFDYEMSQENYDWWLETASEYEAAQYRIFNMSIKYGNSAIQDAISNCEYAELENQAYVINNALDNFFIPNEA